MIGIICIVIGVDWWRKGVKAIRTGTLVPAFHTVKPKIVYEACVGGSVVIAVGSVRDTERPQKREIT